MIDAKDVMTRREATTPPSTPSDATGWLRSHRGTVIIAGIVATVLIVGGVTGGVANAASATHDADLRQATSAHTTTVSMSQALSRETTDLSGNTVRDLADQQAITTAVLGQDGYLGSGTTTAISSASNTLSAAIRKIAEDGSTASNFHLQPPLAMKVAVPEFDPSWSTQRLTAYNSKLRTIAAKIRSDRVVIAHLGSNLQGSVSGIDRELAKVAKGLPTLEQALLAASPLAGESAKSSLAQALTATQKISVTGAQLSAYVTAAKSVQSSQATAAEAAVGQPAGPADPHCAAPVTAVKHIYVSITAQQLWACVGPVLIFDSAVTTGASALTNVHDATPTGTFRINGKYRNVHLVGHDANGSWNDAVAYWIPYIGSTYGFHDASWQTFPFGSPLYTTQGSHGCVHLPVDIIAQVFAWAPVGTQVTIS
jgi:lipoprotein-anchoring transpeptidase ErfK/SrfK